MRAEEKEIDGPDLERAERQQETLLAEHQEEEALPEMAGEGARDIEHEAGGRLVDAIRMILDRDALVVAQLGLPARETAALEALQAAVNGRSTGVDSFVYAEDRRSLLEQALAVLQPNLTNGSSAELAELQGGIESLTKRVTALRVQLSSLKDAQEELIGPERERFVETATDTADKPKPKPSDPDAPRPPSTLAGGPEAKREERPSALSTGPEAKRDERPSTLAAGGPEAKREERPSALSTGPEVKPEPEQPTTLGDGKEIAEAAKTPWWRRPFG